MAGNLVKENNEIYRLGQNNSRDYGNGVMIYKVHKLSTTEYSETFEKIVICKKYYGPHTINIFGNKIVYDYYTITFNLFSFTRFPAILEELISIITGFIG